MSWRERWSRGRRSGEGRTRGDRAGDGPGGGRWRPWRRSEAGAGLPCVEVVEIVTDYLEGALSPELRARFERHIAGCDGCEAYLEQMRTTIRVSGALGEQDVPLEARERFRQAFRDWTASTGRPR